MTRALVLISLLAVAAPVAAQNDPNAPLEIAVGFNVGQSFGLNCSQAETVGDVSFSVTLDDCSPVNVGVHGEFAAHVTDRLTPFIRVSWGRADLTTTAEVADPFQGSFTIPGVSIGISSLNVAGGTRFCFQPRRASIRGFAEIAAGAGRATTGGDLGDSIAMTAFSLRGGVGIDMA